MNTEMSKRNLIKAKKKIMKAKLLFNGIQMVTIFKWSNLNTEKLTKHTKKVLKRIQNMQMLILVWQVAKKTSKSMKMLYKTITNLLNWTPLILMQFITREISLYALIVLRRLLNGWAKPLKWDQNGPYTTATEENSTSNLGNKDKH